MDKQMKDMSLDEAEAEISNAVYAACGLAKDDTMADFSRMSAQEPLRLLRRGIIS